LIVELPVSDSALQPILALIGYPAAANPTQYMMEKAFAFHQLDCRFLTVEVTAENLGDALRGMRAMGFLGGICSDPHKQAAIAHLERTTDRAALVGAVNCLFRQDGVLVGDNNEGQAMVAALKRVVDPAGTRIVILGAGNLARAIAVELAQAKAAELQIVNRTLGRAAELAELLTSKLQATASAVVWEGQYAIPEGIDVVIQATSLGQEECETPLPVDLASLKPGMVVADVILNPPRTGLLQAASECGCQTVDGLELFLQQASLSLRQWVDVEPNSTVMREAVEEFLLL